MRTTFLCVMLRERISSCLKRCRIAGSVASSGTNHLERDQAVQFAIARLVNGAHSALSEDSQNLVASAKDHARLQALESRDAGDRRSAPVRGIGKSLRWRPGSASREAGSEHPMCGALDSGGGVSAAAPTASSGKRVPGIVGLSESLPLWSRSSMRLAWSSES